jgi:ribosomal protein S18 acetylase RimI-like enzyme
VQTVYDEGDMTVVIRAANEADVAALVTLLRRSWLATWAPEVPFSAVQLFVTPDPARTFAKTKWQEMTVAEVDGEVAGMLHIEENWVRSIQLARQRRRRGIGSQLMDEAEQRIRKNYPKARLDVRAFNAGAFEFCERRGWTECRRYVGSECGVSVETIEMAKNL